MKWELVTKAIHMGRTSGSLEDAYESRHKELAGEDQGADTTLSKVSPEPFRSIWNSTSPKYENRQTPSKESISRLSNSLTTSYVKVKKRSAVSNLIMRDWQKTLTLIMFSSQANARPQNQSVSSLKPRKTQTFFHIHEALAPYPLILHPHPLPPCGINQP